MRVALFTWDGGGNQWPTVVRPVYPGDRTPVRPERASARPRRPRVRLQNGRRSRTGRARADQRRL